MSQGSSCYRWSRSSGALTQCCGAACSHGSSYVPWRGLLPHQCPRLGSAHHGGLLVHYLKYKKVAAGEIKASKSADLEPYKDEGAPDTVDRLLLHTSSEGSACTTSPVKGFWLAAS